MNYPIATTFVSIQLQPETTEQGLSIFRATVVYENHAGQISEQISLSVLVQAGDRNFVAIQNEAIARAELILANASENGHPTPSSPISTWEKLAG